MAIGSCFAVMNTMYAATAYRTREIATLRVLGFKKRTILASLMLESLVLALLGGAVGCLLSLPMNGISTGMGNMSTFSEVSFNFRVTPGLVLNGMVFAAIMGVLGDICRRGLPRVFRSFVHCVLRLRIVEINVGVGSGVRLEAEVEWLLESYKCGLR